MIRVYWPRHFKNNLICLTSHTLILRTDNLHCQREVYSSTISHRCYFCPEHTAWRFSACKHKSKQTEVMMRSLCKETCGQVLDSASGNSVFIQLSGNTQLYYDDRPRHQSQKASNPFHHLEFKSSRKTASSEHMVLKGMFSQPLSVSAKPAINLPELVPFLHMMTGGKGDRSRDMGLSCTWK